MSNEKPQFGLTCIQSEYPNHLTPGVTYKVDPWNTAIDNITGKKEVSVYWANPMSDKDSIEWLFIGYFSMDCFNSYPIQKWIRNKKGIPEGSIARTRPAVIQRIRPQSIIRRRPTIIKRTRPGG